MKQQHPVAVAKLPATLALVILAPAEKAGEDSRVILVVDEVAVHRLQAAVHRLLYVVNQLQFAALQPQPVVILAVHHDVDLEAACTLAVLRDMHVVHLRLPAAIQRQAVDVEFQQLLPADATKQLHVPRVSQSSKGSQHSLASLTA